MTKLAILDMLFWACFFILVAALAISYFAPESEILNSSLFSRVVVFAFLGTIIIGNLQVRERRRLGRDGADG